MLDKQIKFKTMYNYIACKRIGDTRRSESGVIRGMTSKEKPLTVEVIDIGPMVNKKEFVSEVKVGDKLLILKYTGIDAELNKEIITFIKTTDIIAKIEG